MMQLVLVIHYIHQQRITALTVRILHLLHYISGADPRGCNKAVIVPPSTILGLFFFPEHFGPKNSWRAKKLASMLASFFKRMNMFILFKMLASMLKSFFIFSTASANHNSIY